VWGGEVCDLGAIHPKCGGRSCDLGGHSSKSLRGREACDLEAIHPKCKGEGHMTWASKVCLVARGEERMQEGETYDFGGNEHANRFYTNPHFSISS
jgi:hypothetical protein